MTLDLPTDLPRRYRYQFRAVRRFGTWEYSYELIGQYGGVHLHVSGPHKYDGSEHWSAGLEMHSRTPIGGEDSPPSHDHCWLLKCPCWHDGTSSYAQEHVLPMVLAEDHASVFRSLVRYADDRPEWASGRGACPRDPGCDQ
jgi:hypothetical protein